MIRTNYMNDTSGHPWARISWVKEGSKLKTDSGFTCLPANVVKRVRKDKDGDLYICCSSGHHFLDGQIKGKVYIGLYLE